MVSWIVLGVLGVLLVAAGALTARPVDAEIPDRDDYFARWRPLHGGIDPGGNVWLHGWLKLSYALARPLATAGIRPDVLTLSTVWITGLALTITVQAPHTAWQVLAGWLIVLSGLGDALDGAVAVATGRATRWGYVLDSLVDRINETGYVVAAVVAGAPPWLGAVAVVGFFLLEYVRARAGNAGGSEVGRITVGERPVRVICCSIAVGGGVLRSVDTLVAVVPVAVLAALTYAGLAQLIVAVHRELGQEKQPGKSN